MLYIGIRERKERLYYHRKRGDLNVIIIMKGKCDAMWEKELKALDVSANRLLRLWEKELKALDVSANRLLRLWEKELKALNVSANGLLKLLSLLHTWIDKSVLETKRIFQSDQRESVCRLERPKEESKE